MCSWSPWTSSKALAAVVESAVLRKEPGSKRDLEEALRKNKAALLNLLKNPTRNPADAELVRKAQTEGIALTMYDQESIVAGDSKQKLPRQVVEEALILAELFNLNEISALQLLLKGEEQLCDYPGLTRGLVAVLLYYDGRKALVQSLRTLIQARKGMTWTLELSDDVADLVNSFTKQIVDEGLTTKCLDLTQSLDWAREAASLQKQMALGDAKHRRQVNDLFQDIRQSLADCIFCLSAQSGLSRSDAVRLLDFLSRVKPGDGQADGVLDNVTITLLTAFLYAIDVSALNKCEDSDALASQLPIIKDPNLIPVLHRELGPSGARKFEHSAIQAVLQFAWAMTVTGLRAVPQNSLAQAVVDDDEAVADLALDNRVFHLLPDVVLANEMICKEEFYQRRFHSLVTDFILLMPLKVKELRNRADDAARNSLMHEQEGITYNMPLVGQHFGHLMKTIAKLYEKDSLGLVLDYWCPADNGNAALNTSHIERFPQRQVSLYKFVRLAGDLLMPSLYTPYVNMLVSLSGHPQSALHCFNLLKLNDLGGQQGGSTVSWEHFFLSMQQYFANLRQEVPQRQAHGDTIYRLARPMTKGISPAEIQGLVTVLRLIQSVCDNCDAARVALAENTTWQPVLVLIGLLGCAVPTPLKAQLIRTLASMVKSSPELALSTWQNIESAQLVNTLPQTLGTIPKQGMATELEDMETRMEEYPMTIAFLHLVDSLTDSVIPHSLGAGTRSPGFEPYLNFVRDSILLRFNTRAYKNVAEKWEIAVGCLRILAKLLEDYVPSVQDFAAKSTSGLPHQGAVHHPQADSQQQQQQQQQQQEQPLDRVASEPQGCHPGFYLMVHLMQTTDLLRMVLFILDEGCAHFDTYLPFPGKSFLEEACILALKLVQNALLKQNSFLEAARNSNSSLLLTALDQLLLGVNPRSGKADHMLNVSKFITYAWWLPEHALYAVRVLSHVSDSPSAQAGLLTTLNSNDQTGSMIIKGFTDLLDTDEEEQEEEAPFTLKTGSQKHVSMARIAVVELLLKGLDKPAPSLSHFLLGFDIKRDVSKSNLQPPGFMGSIRTSFHAILAFLRPVGPRQPAATLMHAPNLSEIAYKLMYHLAAHPQTSEPTLRYLRSTEDFLCSQLNLLPLDEAQGYSLAVTKGISWLLKTAAIELKIVCASRLRSQVSLLIGLLLDGEMSSTHLQNDDLANSHRAEVTMTQLSRLSNVTTRSGPQGHSGHPQHRLLQILNSVDFLEDLVDMPAWEMFDAGQISKLVKSCEKQSGVGEKCIDVVKLHAILNAELASVQGIAQRQIIQEDIRSILLYCVRWNSVQEQALAKKNILDAWRQVAEVMLCSVPADILPSSAKQQLLLDILQTLFNKVLADGTMAELSNQVSGVVLLLVAALRQTYASESSPASGLDPRSDNYVSILDAPQEVEKNARGMYTTALHVILKGLINWITNISASAQRVRANLYGALVNFLRIGKPSSANSDQFGVCSMFRSSDLALTEQAKFRKTNLEVISSFGDNFLDILCRDSVSGHDIRRMLALSVLDELVHLDGRGSWTYYMARQGYLRHIIESMSVEDHRLLELLSAEPVNLKALYTYESKMAMLTRLASTVAGAELLLQSGLMVRLSDMHIFASRPDLGPSVNMEVETDDYSPECSPLRRYYQILFPALRLCQALLASLGVMNQSVTSQILHFITSNEDLLRSVLRPRGIFSLMQLQELSLLTGVVARCVSSQLYENSTNIADLEVVSYVTRVQRQMLALIPHLDLNDDLISHVQKVIPERQQGDAMRFIMETIANVFVFARNVAASGGQNTKFERVIFTPSLAAAKETTNELDDRFSSVRPGIYNIPTQPPTLGHVVRQVRHLTLRVADGHKRLSEVTEKLNAVDQLSSVEVSNFVPAAVADKMSAAEKRKLAAEKMTELASRLDMEIRLCGGAIESGMLLVWRHFEHFLIYATSASGSSLTPFQRAHLKKDDTLLGHEIDEIDNQLSLSVDAVEALKGEAGFILNELFFTRLQEVAGILAQRKGPNSDVSFLEVVIRRMKRLVSLQI